MLACQYILMTLRADRTTPLGTTINQYLRKEVELHDRAAHLLFSANRWELRSAPRGPDGGHTDGGPAVLTGPRDAVGGAAAWAGVDCFFDANA